jgi:hypothetical protein
MIRRTFLWSLPLLILAPAFAADPAGSWDCQATSPDGDQLPYSLHVKKQDDRYIVTISSDRGEVPLPDARIEGNKLTFTVPRDGVTYTVTMTFDGDTVKGTYQGGDVSGPVSGKRRR